MTKNVALIAIAVAAVIAGVSVAHAIADLISYAAIGYVVFSGYRKMQGKISAEKQKALALKSELDTATLLLEQNHISAPKAVQSVRAHG